MNKRVLLNVMLAGLLIALGLIAYFQPGREQTVVQPELTSLKHDDIQKIKIVRAGKETIILEKSGHDWRLTEPLQITADDFLVDSILGLAMASSFAQIEATGTELAKFGLSAPRVTVWLNDTEIVFGDTEPISGRRYVRVGSTVHLIPDSHYFRLNGNLYSFVARNVLPPAGRIQTIRLAGQTISRLPDGGWQLSPEQQGISQDAIVAFVDEWRRARAISVSGSDNRKTTASIEIELENNKEPMHFELSHQDNDWLLVRPVLGVQYHFTENQFKRLTDLSVNTKPDT